MANQPISSQYNNPLVFAFLLTDADAAAGLLSVANNTGVDLIITNCVMNVKTVATGAQTTDVGVAATSILDDTLLDGIDGHSATGTFGAADGGATNAHLQKRWPATQFLTASTASGASAGMVATLYVTCIPVPAGG